MRNTARGTRHGVVAGLMISSVLLGGGMFLAGCSGGSSSVASSSEAAGQAAAANQPARAAVPSAAALGSSGGKGGAGTTARLAPASSIIYTAQLTVRARDVSSAAAQAAIAQLRALLSHAGSVGDLLSVQNQINSEESNLESMQAQQRALSHETSYATVTLTILGPKAKPLLHRPKAPPTLAGGFGAGWHALRVAVSWTLAFLGAIAPFAVVLAVAGYVVYRGRRWLNRRRPTAGPASPGS